MNPSVSLKKKICMLGGYAVGKTSLVRHFVEGIFSEKYQITIGVKIDKKTVSVGDASLTLMLWDIAGEEEKFAIPPTYLTGAAGFLLVMDGTRKQSYDQAVDIFERVEQTLGTGLPFVAVLNKEDLDAQWEMPDSALDEMRARGWQVVTSSARLGTGVEEAFSLLAEQLV
mgnify:CR=1 FL=1